jgi:hypothetical protein
MATFLKGTIQNFNLATLFRFYRQLGIINMNTTASSLNFLNNQRGVAFIGKGKDMGTLFLNTITAKIKLCLLKIGS